MTYNIHDYILHYSKNYSSRKQLRVYTPYTQKYIDDWFKYTDENGRRYQRRQRGKDGNGNAIWEKQYLDESKGVPLTTVWNDIKQVYADPRAYKIGLKVDVEVIKEFSGGQKPESLIQRIFNMCTTTGDIVLDFHLGTGTTAAVAHKMGLQYIGCEQIDSQIEIILARLDKVINGEAAGVSKEVNWQGGGSFVYCELAQLNDKYVEAIGVSQNDASVGANRLDLSVEDWFVFNDNYGTSEEKAFVRYFKDYVDTLRSKYDKVYLLRNERQIHLYSFDGGERFEPDYILYLCKNHADSVEQLIVFVEPKGTHLIDSDKWKEDFLLELKEKAIPTVTFVDDNKYKIWGFHFFNTECRSVEFASDMNTL